MNVHEKETFSNLKNKKKILKNNFLQSVLGKITRKTILPVAQSCYPAKWAAQ